MTETWFCPDRLFDGETVRDGLALHVVDGHAAGVVPAGQVPADSIRVPGIVSPGFIDLQVNGGGGVLLNATPTVEGMERIAEAHRALGTVGILPTVITDAPEVLDQAVAAALAAKGRPGLLGLHIEGPHISVPRRGTHASAHVRPFDPATLEHVRRLRAADIPVMITLAPEAASPQDIAALAGTGAVVSIGHSDASAEETRTALEAGASCFTHLFNAMSPMLNRAPGVVGAAINSTAHAGIIADGIHVADEMIALALRARPVPNRMFLVSDAMPTVGGPDQFSLYGQDLRLQDGRLVNSEGSLAGAHLTQAMGVARLVNVLGLDPDEALKMALTVPARLIGRDDLTKIEGRALGDLIVLDAEMHHAGSLVDRLPATVRA